MFPFYQLLSNDTSNFQRLSALKIHSDEELTDLRQAILIDPPVIYILSDLGICLQVTEEFS